MRFRIELTTETAAAISRSRGTGNQLRSLDFIPGSSWRGAMAAEVIRRKGLGKDAHHDSDFRALFLEGKARFGDLRIDGDRPWPLSARVCALEPEEHAVHDFLLGKLAETCPECGAKLKAPSGFLYYPEGRPGTRDVKARINAHTAISNQTLRIRTEQFFSTQVIERKQHFRGRLIADDALSQTVRQYLPETGAFMAVGRGGTRGQGHSIIEAHDDKDEPAESISERLREVNRRFAPAGSVAFTCTLLSACIVYDKWLMSRPFLSASDIAEAAGGQAPDLAGYRLTNWFSRPVTLSGWNAQAGLPKPDCHGIAAGSAFLFTSNEPGLGLEAEMERIAKILASAAAGIGERCEEGFGEAAFCIPFHYEQAIV